MKLLRTLVPVCAVVFLTAGACDDDDPTDNDPNIAGVYTVSEFRYTADSGSPSVDLASIPPSSGGPYGILDMTVEEDNSFSGTLKLLVNGVPQQFDAGGDIEFMSGNNVRIDFDAATDALQILDDFEDGTLELEGNTITINLPDVTFNFGSFGGANESVDSNLRIVATRS